MVTITPRLIIMIDHHIPTGSSKYSLWDLGLGWSFLVGCIPVPSLAGFLNTSRIFCSRFYQNSFPRRIILNLEASVSCWLASPCERMCDVWVCKTWLLFIHLHWLVLISIYFMHIKISQCTAILSLWLEKFRHPACNKFSYFFCSGKENFGNVKEYIIIFLNCSCSTPVASIFTC